MTRNARIARFRNNVLGRTKAVSQHARPISISRDSRSGNSTPAPFPWLSELEAATETIAEELRAVMAAERAELVPYIQYDEHLPLAQWRPLNRNPDWTAIHLWRNGERIEANARHCPRTLALLGGLPQPDNPGRRPQRDVLAACARHRDPAACRRQQRPAGLPPSPGRS